MNQSELSPIEKAIAKNIDKTKNKASQPGYLRKLVAKLHLRIEAALARGCEYDDLAESITESGVKISSATLKQYHTEYRRSLNQEAEATPNTVSSILPTEQPEKIEQVSETVNKLNQKQSAVDKLFANK
jgi:predicted transcriptional regulator